MFALVAELPPLWQVIGSLVEDVDLTIGTVGAHDILLDRLSNSDRFDELAKIRERALPVVWRDDLDNAGLHSIGINSFHLQRNGVSMRLVLWDEGRLGKWAWAWACGRVGATYEFLEVFKLVHGRLEDRDGARPMVGEDLADVLIILFRSWDLLRLGRLRASTGGWCIVGNGPGSGLPRSHMYGLWRIGVGNCFVEVAQFGVGGVDIV